MRGAIFTEVSIAGVVSVHVDFAILCAAIRTVPESASTPLVQQLYTRHRHSAAVSTLVAASIVASDRLEHTPVVCERASVSGNRRRRRSRHCHRFPRLRLPRPRPVQ